MRIKLYAAGSNPATDRPIHKISSFRACEMEKTGKVRRLPCGSVQLKRTEEHSSSKLSSAMDWLRVRCSDIPPLGKAVTHSAKTQIEAISERRLRNLSRSGVNFLMVDTQQVPATFDREQAQQA